MAAELDERNVDIDMIWEGILRFAIGLGKKVLIANNIGVIWTNVKAMDFADIPVATAWLGIGAYTLQIYFDFSLVIPTWQLDSAKCLVFIFRKTSITHICQKALQNSGEDGTLRFPPGLKATSIFRWAAAGKAINAQYLTLLSSGF